MAKSKTKPLKISDIKRNVLSEKIKIVRSMVDRGIMPEDNANYVIEALDKEN